MTCIVLLRFGMTVMLLVSHFSSDFLKDFTFTIKIISITIWCASKCVCLNETLLRGGSVFSNSLISERNTGTQYSVFMRISFAA